MVVREEGEAVICVGQPAHAFISGQIARAWGNERFGPVEPREETCLGAEQHDIGMAAWDAAPELNRDTGRPYSFMELPIERHLAMWAAAPGRVLPQSRYAALLVSMHGAALYERREPPPEHAHAVEAFLAFQRELQSELLAALRSDPATADAAGERRVRRNRALVWTWDTLSLAVLLRWAPMPLEDVPTAKADEPARVDLRPDDQDPEHRFTLDPWPFAANAVPLHCEGRRLEGRFDDEDEMRAALARAPWVTLEFGLAPAARA
jgi:hypothetical protein